MLLYARVFTTAASLLPPPTTWTLCVCSHLLCRVHVEALRLLLGVRFLLPPCGLLRRSQVVRLDNGPFYPLSHLSNPHFNIHFLFMCRLWKYNMLCMCGELAMFELGAENQT